MTRLAIRSAAAICLAAGAAAAQPSFHRLGNLDASLGGPSIANAVSADGTVVVGMSNSPTGIQAFRWTQATGMVGLGAFDNPSGFPSSQALAVSADGVVIGGASVRPASLNEDGSPFRWTSADGMTFLGSLGGTEGGSVRGLSPDGSIMVGSGSSPDFSYRAFAWTMAGGYVVLPAIQGQAQASAAAVSSDGVFIVGQADITFGGNPRAVEWRRSNGVYAGALLPQLNPNATSSALSITSDARVVVGQSAGRAARWINGTVENLGLIPGGLANTTYLATGVSSDGNTVVGLGDYNVTQGTGTAVIWDPDHGMRDLNVVLATDFGLDLQGFQCFYARAITPDGKTIVGYGFGDAGQEAFMVDLRGGPTCYANCDVSTTPPILNANDFQCFLNLFAAGDTAANCDGSTSAPVLNANDFQCFLNAFAAGCS